MNPVALASCVITRKIPYVHLFIASQINHVAISQVDACAFFYIPQELKIEILIIQLVNFFYYRRKAFAKQQTCHIQKIFMRREKEKKREKEEQREEIRRRRIGSGLSEEKKGRKKMRRGRKTPIGEGRAWR